MRTLQFKVAGQNLSKNGDFSGIVAGTKGYLRLCFDFDPEWAGCKKAVIFSRYDREQALPVINGGCPVPDEIAKHNRVCMDGKRCTQTNHWQISPSAV